MAELLDPARIPRHIGIIMDGKLIALGSMKELQEEASSDRPELEPIFLKLTGGLGFREVDEAYA